VKFTPQSLLAFGKVDWRSLCDWNVFLMTSSADDLKKSTFLITGGTGSFGSTMAKYLLERGAGQVRIFSRDEAKQDLMRHSIPDERLRFYIGDTRDEKSIKAATKGVHYVFHAAALKQVPSAEFFPLEAVKTNIDGSANVVSAAIENGVQSVVCLSTDKAVYPINAMGMSKALMEKTAMSFARMPENGETSISVTRYGNVMYSRGSVIPLFIDQIKSGKPLSVTDPRMTRFLMSLSESVDLVEYAFKNASTGDLFVRKAPAATIEVLVQALLELFDAKNRDVVNIGFRHGEKLYESLLSTEERAFAVDMGDYYKVPLDARELNYALYFEEGSARETELDSYNSHNTTRLDVEGVKELLLRLPEVKRELGLN
jgi:UDP-glucose 4-epimerase